ncbi:MAG: DUF3144 domain-containing protein [Pyrinomonadaceae bacterium]|nr:DUF3144 domain-containing protein [Pyrinomonadaceae bacterium]
MRIQDDPTFFDCADAHIHLSNSQMTGEIGPGKVSASMMYATARFNAYVSWIGFDDPKHGKRPCRNHSIFPGAIPGDARRKPRRLHQQL